MPDPINIDGINSVGPLKTGYVGYRDSFPDMPAFGTEYDQDRMSLPFDSSGSFQSDQDIFNILASAYPSESAEQIANRLGSLTANTAMSRQFGGAAPDPYTQFLQGTPPGVLPVIGATTTPPAAQTNDGILDNLLGGAKDATKAVAGVIDSGLQILGDIFGMGDPSLVVLNPTSPSGTVVYGTPTGNATPTIIGNMPKSGAPVGVMTGIPALDEILAGIFNQRGQGGKSTQEIIKDILLGKIGEATGYPVAGVAGAIEGGLGGDFNKVVEGINKVVLNLDDTIKKGDDAASMVAGPAGAFNPNDVGPLEELGLLPPGIIKTTFPPVDPSAGVINLPPQNVKPDPYSIIRTNFPPMDPFAGVINLPPTPPDGPPKKPPVIDFPVVKPPVIDPPVIDPPVVVNPPKIIDPPLPPMLPGVGSGFRGVALTPGDLVELNYLFDIGGEDIFAPMVQGGVEKRNISPYATKASGGIVSKQSIDELFRILGV